MVNVGQNFGPVVVRVSDSASPPHPVQGAVVTFQTTILRPDQDAPIESNGETSSSNHRMPVILGSSQAQVSSDANGLASAVPSAGSSTGAVELEITVSAGTSAMQQVEAEAVWPVPPGGGGSTPGAGSSTAFRNGTNVGDMASAPTQNYFAGEIWAVAAESGNGTSPTLIAVPDGQTEILSSDQPKPENERQSDSVCDPAQNAAQECANKIEKPDFPQ